LDRVGAINRLRVYASGNNLHTFTGYSGVNPQVRYEDENLGQSETGSTGGALAPGIERRIEWYTARSFSLGIDLSF
jgi:iron complex outermembrane receptor protein